MIRTREDLRRYLEADRRALGVPASLAAFLFHDVWRFQRALRRAEYHHNSGSFLPLRLFWKWRARRIGTKLGFTIPLNVFGPGLSIAHVGTIVVNHGARIGANCRIHVCVNIGTAAGRQSAAPTIGDDCYLAPGAKLFGPIVIGNDVAVGANAVVNRSFPEDGVTLGGVPARIIARRGRREIEAAGGAADSADPAL